MGTSLSSERSHRAGWRQAAGAVCGLGLLVGCQNLGDRVADYYDTHLPLDRPVDWWHQFQGGPVAADRPPPPGVADPYPNFAKIPPRPATPNLAGQRALVARLTTERNATTRLNQQYPIVFSSPNAAPTKAKPGSPAAPATNSDTSLISLDAANATPTAVAPATPAAANDPHPPASLVTAQAGAPVVSGPIPAIPQAAPPLPQLPGMPISETVPVVPRPIPTAPVTFAQGSAALPEGAEAALKALAARRSGAAIAVVAGGEARSWSAGAQLDALPLALRRTGAITAALIAAGVPAGDIHAEAVAAGRDASARLLN